MAVVQVGGVYPAGFAPSITGEVICGDGHVCGGVSTGTQFGTPTLRTPTAVVGVPSAQAFGVVTAKATYTLAVGSVASAQLFGVPRLNSTQAVVGVGSAQAFGVPTISARYAISVPGVPSAQAFGLARPSVSITVLGVSSAAAFGLLSITFAQVVPVGGVLPYGPQIDSICGEVICGDGHLCGYSGGPREQFGRVTILAGPVTVAVGGVASAQAFGVLRVFLVWVRDSVCLDLDLPPSVATTTPLLESSCLTMTPYVSPVDTTDLEPSPVLDLDLEPAGCR